MLRLFVTGDNHLGLKYASHPQAAVLAQSRIQAFERMVEAANENECSLFVMTGDLFENTYGINKKDIKQLFGYLSKFKGLIALIPGNHDYYDRSTKLWQSFHECMDSMDNLLLLNEYRPYSLDIHGERVTLYPAFCTSLHSQPGKNNLDWIKQTQMEQEGYRIGIAHGAVEKETIDQEGQYFLMSREELEQIDVDVWLIGHTHVPFPRHLTNQYTKTEKILNAGTHVQTDVSCLCDGQCFVVELFEDKEVKAKLFSSGQLHFYRKDLHLEAGKMEELLHRELDELSDQSVVELILSGAVTAEEYEQRHVLLNRLLNRFLEGSFNDYGMSQLISKELIDAEFPETSFASSFLTSLLDEPKEAQLVYELMKSLKEER